MNRLSCNLKNSFSTVTHVIFDMDGVLLDTEILYTKIVQNILDPYGKIYTPEVKSHIMGFHSVEAANFIIQTYDLPMTQEEYLQKLFEKMNIMMPQANLMPDSEKIHKTIIKAIAKKYGKIYTPDIASKLLGTTKQDTCKIAVNEMKLPITPEQFDREFNKLGNQHLESVEYLPGAERLVQHLYSKNIPIAVATSSSRESYELKSKKHTDFFSLFNHKVLGGSDPEVKSGKPSPDIFLVCATRFPDKPLAKDCLVIEDAPNGVLAAVRAGMQCVMVPDTTLIKPDQMNNATLVLKSLLDFQPELFGLPPFSCH